MYNFSSRHRVYTQFDLDHEGGSTYSPEMDEMLVRVQLKVAACSEEQA
jgi:hypothetical protein